MKTRLTFQALILWVVGPVLLVITGFWVAQVYSSTHRIILDGFDGKLLAVAQGTAASIDGDSHAEYQRRRTLLAFTPLSPTTFAAIDPASDEIVTLDATTGGARRLVAVPAGGIRTLTSTESLPLVGLASDGATVVRFGADGSVIGSTPLASHLDGIFADAAGVIGWFARALFRIDLSTGELAPMSFSLPESVLSVTIDPTTGHWYGLAIDRNALIAIDRHGTVVRRLALRGGRSDGAGSAGDAPLLHAISFLGPQLYGVGDGLTRIDRDTGLVERGDFKIGFFDMSERFYRQHRPAFTHLQQRAGLTYLYTQVYLGDKQIYYIMDGTLGSGLSPPGSIDVLPQASIEGAERVQYVGRPWISPIQQWQAWGLLKSGLAPVRNSTGSVVAIAGADVDIGMIRRKTRWAMFGAILVGVCSFVAAGFISLGVAATLTRPLRRLKEAALWIAAGYYGTRVAVTGSREVSALAVTLDRLRGRLEQEQTQSETWQNHLRAERERTALIRALDDTAVRLGLLADAAGATDGCRSAGTTIWWFGAPDPDALTSGCRRARLVVLAHELLAAGYTGDDLLVRILACFPGLHGIACWHAWKETLHHRTHAPIAAHFATATHSLADAGEMRCDSIEALRWDDPMGKKPLAGSPPNARP